MALPAGTRIGSYEITAKIGEGGMGEVYRATDTKLKRPVALKVLPESVANDRERLARFQREAEVLASLNHTNIAGIYGVEESGGVKALVMEFVDGPTLADRIAQGALPLDDALPIAKQIAEALEAAHEQGIIHRDLKPANIKVRPDDTVKVLDFGLAKAMDAGQHVGRDFSPAGHAGSKDPAYVPLSQAPTITSPAMMTGVGMILGTAAYMSPEQAKGQRADQRSDMWSYGCVLYEMLTGRRAFEGDDVSDTLASVLKTSPEWSMLPAETPPAVRQLVTGCLQKDRRHRVSSAGTTLFALNAPALLSADRSTPSKPRARLPLFVSLAAALVIGVAGGGATARWLVPSPVSTLVRSTIMAPDGQGLRLSGNDCDIAISRDGSRIAYIGGAGATTQVFVRALDQANPTSVYTGTAPRSPFFSPDGQWIGFFDGNTDATRVIRRVAVTGGPAITVTRVTGAPRGGAWMADGSIVFGTANVGTGLQRVPVTGGPLTELTKTSDARDHLWPQLLPDGKSLLFTVIAPGVQTDQASIAVADINTGNFHVVVEGGSHARYVETGHLVYGSDGTLRAVPFDIGRQAVSGTAVPVIPDVVTTTFGAANFDVAVNGTLVYVRGTAGNTLRTMLWVDRMGREEQIKAPPRAYSEARLSPDNTQIALDIRDQDNDIWLWNFARATLTRLTFEPGGDQNPVWTSDGTRLAYSPGTRGDIIIRRADGTGNAERFQTGRSLHRPKAFTPDGSALIVWEQPLQRATDLLLLPLSSPNGKPEPLLAGEFSDDNPGISPDGRWIAYQTDESGQSEVYVRPFPGVNDGRWQISNGGGSRPVWSHKGDELFFLDRGGYLTAVTVHTAGSFSADVPRKLHDVSYYPGPAGRGFDVSQDDRRFLMIKDAGDAQVGQNLGVSLVQNWFDELKRLVPTN